MNEIDFLEQRAVDAAMGNDWKQAIECNTKILKLDSKNLAACLRLGFAHLQQKNIPDAQKFYQKALRIQPKNHVAIENLDRLKVLQEQGSKKITDQARLDPNLFLEIPGKTRTVSLVNIGQKKDIVELEIGQIVELKVKKRKIEARTKNGGYIGSLPDDLSKRLMYFLKAKSKYVAYIKEANLNRVILFIHEVLKGKKVAHYSSFPHNIQTNMNHMNEESAAEADEDTGDEEEWDGVGHELVHEDKEELVDIHPEEEDVEE